MGFKDWMKNRKPTEEDYKMAKLVKKGNLKSKDIEGMKSEQVNVLREAREVYLKRKGASWKAKGRHFLVAGFIAALALGGTQRIEFINKYDSMKTQTETTLKRVGVNAEVGKKMFTNSPNVSKTQLAKDTLREMGKRPSIPISRTAGKDATKAAGAGAALLIARAGYNAMRKKKAAQAHQKARRRMGKR
ncbi:MAG: hypothetical protein JW703_04320 [Candidatus Diapherotrites archaeon]|nr:hypothetical protein [Candidatus Diapherotrites archaeon]